MPAVDISEAVISHGQWPFGQATPPINGIDSSMIAAIVAFWKKVISGGRAAIAWARISTMLTA